ncbi:MAG: YIP1 family protein [Mariprofundaceae bacterium]|nr:YIP1 family protein [Mariprofundaceae bacterium]
MSDTASTNDTATGEASIVYFQSSQPAQTLIGTIKSLIMQPRGFFAGMPFAVFYANSLFFATIVVLGLSFLSVPFYNLGMLFMVPVIWGVIIIGMRLLAMYMHWAVPALAGGRLTTANAFQLSAYASMPMLFVGLSWFGIVAFLWSMYLLWVGLTSYCRIRTGGALAVIILPLLMVAMVGGGFMFAFSRMTPSG